MAIRDISEFADYIKDSRNVMMRAYGVAFIEMMQKAEALAVQNAKKQFKGRNSRRLTGRLINSIFSSFETNLFGRKIVGFLGTKGIPYGAIHEFGGKITPKKAKHLWVRMDAANKGRFKNITPTEFVNQMGRAGGSSALRFRIAKFGGAKFAFVVNPRGGNIQKLFNLVKEVNMPERPYLTPAAEDAASRFPMIARRRIKEALGGSR